VTVAKIGTETGIEAARKALVALDPAHDDAYNKLLGKPGTTYNQNVGPVEGTITKLVRGHNELLDRVAALDENLRLLNERVAALEARPPSPLP
jgi:hypothetical protein